MPFLDQHFPTKISRELSSNPTFLGFWCVFGLALLAPQPPAITCVLYCEGVNKSATAPLSVPSLSEASALAFCSVIYARLLPKMSFHSPAASSACERVWHLSVFINFKDAFAWFCHSLRWLLIIHPPLHMCSFYLQNLLSPPLPPSQVWTFWCHLFLLFVSISCLFCSRAALQENQ